MRFISSDQLEQHAQQLLRSWQEAEGTRISIPVDVKRLATDFLGIEVAFGSLEKGIVAEFKVADEMFVLDERQNRNPARARFSIAHEVGHLQLHSNLRTAVFCRASDVNRQELQANRFAAALLMPGPDLVGTIAEAVARLGKFTQRAAEGDLSVACRWLRNLLAQQPLTDSVVKTIAQAYGVSTQSLRLRITQLGVIGE